MNTLRIDSIPTENILGFQVSTLDQSETINLAIDGVLRGDPVMTFFCANPHSLVTAIKDNKFKSALQRCDLLTPDGIGIVLASKFLRGRICERVTGSDVFNGVSRELDSRKVASRIFFLGSSKDVLDAIELKFSRQFYHLIVAGTYSPPYKSEFTEEETRSMINRVNDAKTDILWVAMTAPKQEKWIMSNIDRLNVRFVGGVGAVFDFYIGRVKRSPLVFQKVGLEWLPRLLQEPRRLFKRNFISSPLFLFKVMQQRFSRY